MSPNPDDKLIQLRQICLRILRAYDIAQQQEYDELCWQELNHDDYQELRRFLYESP